MTNSKLRFQRFEFKYPISFRQFKQIRSFLQKYLALDDFAKNTKEGFYEVVSLYYDSSKFYYYWEKIDGVKRRKKIRLRAYRRDGQFVDPAFFEIKRKHDAVILKDRFLLVDEDYKMLMSNKHFSNEKEDTGRNKIIKEFHLEWALHQLEPKVLVVYNREPYFDKFNNNFKVTFDYFIKARRQYDLFYNGDDYIDVLKNGVIMEVKFNNTMPFYMQQVIKEYNLNRIAYSKYCKGLSSCYPLLN